METHESGADNSAIASRFFHGNEEVLQSVSLIAGEPVPCFEQTEVWDLNALQRNANQAVSHHRISFPKMTAIWNLRLREIAMVMLNPCHIMVRRAGLFLPMSPAAPSTIRSLIRSLHLITAWASDTGLSVEPSAWTQRDLDKYINSGLDRPKKIKALKFLYRFNNVLTNGGLHFEPWPGQSTNSIGSKSSPQKSVSTDAIPPLVWWPLLRAAWTYIDKFSDDIFTARSRWSRLGEKPNTRPPGSNMDMLQAWLADPSNKIPLHRTRSYSGCSKLNDSDVPVHWRVLSWLVTQGWSAEIFSSSADHKGKVMATVLSPENQGRYEFFTLLGDAKQVDAPNGPSHPWATDVDALRMWHELVALRTACYIFVAALSMMRDSELQGILRDPIVQYYGAPAIRSRKFKHDQAHSEQRWWIIEPVAQAIAVAEQLSLHPTRIFASVRDVAPEKTSLSPIKDIKKFVAHVNKHHVEMGLEPIPAHRITPHMFRRTMAIIAGQQPDGEIALGLTLKHAAIRALSNSVTGGYANPTSEWAQELRIELADATAVRLAHLLQAHVSGETIAVGPGAKFFNTKLDRVADQLNLADSTQANIVDSRFIRNRLRTEFSGLKFGNLNACLGEANSALCLTDKDLNADSLATINPARCQPHLCRNSVVTTEHLPQWLATEEDLINALGDRRVSKINRESLEQELADIRTVIEDTHEPRIT